MRLSDAAGRNGRLTHTTLASGDKFLVWHAGQLRTLTATQYKAYIAAVGPRARYRIAMGRASISPVEWFFYGDSITEGYDPDAAGGFDRIADRWPTRLLALQRTRFGLSAGGLGYLNLLNNIGDGRWSFAVGGSGSTGVSLVDTHAFAHQSYGLGNNVTATLTVTGTSCGIHYKLGSSAFKVSVDGAAAVTVTPAAGSAFTGLYKTPVKSHGSHTYAVSPVSSANHVGLLGAMCYDGDETTGCHAWDNSQSGIGAYTAVAGVGALSGESGYVPTDQLAVCVNPPIVLITLGINDFLGSTSTATFTTAMQTIINQTKAACSIPPSIFLVGPHDMTAARVGGSPAWSAYVTAYQALVTANASCVSMLDESALFTAPTNANSHSSGKCCIDNVHLTTTGNQKYATDIDAALAA